jgi:signal transduction histidine kinase
VNIPGHLRAVVRQHPHLADATVAAVVLAATLVTTFAGHPAAPVRSRPVALAAALIACAVLTVRRRHPIAVLVLSASAAEVFLGQINTTSGVLVLLAPSIALYTVADLVKRRISLCICTAALLVLALAHVLINPELLGPQNLALTALGGLAIAAGDSSRNRRAYLAELEQRAHQAERDRERDAQRRIAEERLRIARDLHDSVGHHLALISVQSDVAVLAMDHDPGAAHASLRHVKSATRKALEELRDTIGLLRQPGDPVAPTAAPALGLDALTDLVEALHASGLSVESRVEGGAVPLAPSADLTAYRVIQEALTNVYKHSSARHARLTLDYLPGELRICVEDLGGGTVRTVNSVPLGWHGIAGTGRTGEGHTGTEETGTEQTGTEQTGTARTVTGTRRTGTGQTGTGHGIAGMRERVEALGGRFSAGPATGSRGEATFRVTATVPCQPADLVRSRGAA